jgi:beta-lactamase superfamily II metal-dependent hydrolase
MKYFCIIDKQSAPAEYLTVLDGELESEQSNDSTEIRINENPNFFVIKLLGVRLDSKNFVGKTFKELKTFELNKEDFDEVKSSKGNLFVHSFKKQLFSNDRFAIITITENSYGKSTFYSAYDMGPPKKISVSSISFQKYDFPRFLYQQDVFGVLNNPFDDKDLSIRKELSSDDFELLVFGVGQGMCSLLRSKSLKFGILLDVGAGTPVKRDNYLKGSIRNDLLKEFKELDTVYLLLSHLDSDHFRLMMWCSVIQGKISEIYIPSGSANNSLAFKHSSIFHKVKEVDSFKLLAGKYEVEATRTKPANSSIEKNDNELITKVKVNGGEKIFLFPGDYVYKKMISDGEVKINDLQKLNFDFVVAPHHGDNESGHSVPLAKIKKQSEVFFSAGDHAGYNHPTTYSIDAHNQAGFTKVSYLPNPNIEIVKVLN